MAFHRGYQPVLAKHTKNFNLTHALEIGVSDMQCNFDGMVQQIDRWRDSRLTDVSARMIVYEAFIEAETDFPATWPAPSTISISIRSTRSLAPDDVEPLQRLHERVQTARPRSAVSRDRPVGTVPGSAGPVSSLNLPK
jgi:hypothetical protein